MKKVIALIFVLPVILTAQVDTKHQPSFDWFSSVRAIHIRKNIPKDSLLKMKPRAIPDKFQDTLRKYDWVDLGGYQYLSKSFTVWYDTEPLQYNFSRLYAGDTVVDFICNKGVKKIQHTNFSVSFGNLPTYTVKKNAGTTFIELCTYGSSKEYLRLISFQNGVLVVDTPVNGKMTDKKMFSRHVWLAVDKSFEWKKEDQ